MMAYLTDAPTLTTDRLVLRVPGLQDWEPLRDFLATDRSQFVGGPVDLGKAWRSFGHIAGHWMLRGYGSFIICEKGSDEALGLTGPWYPADWPEQEIGWSLWKPELEGTGIAYEAASAAIAYAFDSLGWQTAVSYIDKENTRSIKLAERLGAVRDDDAIRPHEDDLVYRHPAPGAAG